MRMTAQQKANLLDDFFGSTLQTTDFKKFILSAVINDVKASGIDSLILQAGGVELGLEIAEKTLDRINSDSPGILRRAI